MKTRVSFSLLFWACVGCGKAANPPDAGPPDAGRQCLPAGSLTPDAGASDGGDFSCMGQAPGAIAVEEFSVSGFVTAAGLARTPVVGAQVELFSEGGQVLVSTHTSSDGGTYHLKNSIGCMPLNGTLRASKPDAGFSDAWYYPSRPWRHNREGLELVVFDSAAQSLVAAIANVTVQSGTAALALGVDDCAGQPVVGATVSSTPSGDVRYVTALGLPSFTEPATTTKGQLLIFNVPPGNVTLTASVGGRTYPARTVNARAGAITSTTLVP